MRYLVKARVKPGQEQALLAAIRDGSLGRGSIAGDEYLHNMQQARLAADGTVRWVEVCFCREPLDEERAYWEEFFECYPSKTPTPARTAATKMAPSPGRVAIATARKSSKPSSRAKIGVSSRS